MKSHTHTGRTQIQALAAMIDTPQISPSVDSSMPGAEVGVLGTSSDVACHAKPQGCHQMQELGRFGEATKLPDMEDRNGKQSVRARVWEGQHSASFSLNS